MPVYNVISPLLYDTPTKTFSIQVANSSQSGYLSSADWINFDGKQDAIILTTTGTSGAATFVANTLNIPVYTPDLSGYVPTSRTLTINGVTYDLSANRSWTIAAGVASVTATSPLFSSGGADPDISIQVANATQDGYLSSGDWNTFNSKQSALTFSSPLVNTAGVVSIPAATTSVSGYLTNTDWNTFNAKQGALTLTTTGTSGPSTLVGDTLNIPQYQSVLTNPVTGTGVAGQVAFWNGTSSVTGDAGLVWDNTNKRLGISVASPAAKLEINGGTNASLLRLSTATRDATFSLDTFGYITVGGTLGAFTTLRSFANLFFAGPGVIHNTNTGGGTGMKIIGTGSTTGFLDLQATSGNGNSSTHIKFLGGNNGATEIARFLSSGNVVIGSTTDAGFRLDVNGTFRQTGSTTAASAIARGSFISPTLVAAANNDVLVGLDINPTFTNGAFTGVTNWAARIQGASIVTYNNNNYQQGFYIQNTSTGTNAITGMLLRNSSGTDVAAFSYYPSNYVTTSQQNTAVFATVTTQKLGFQACAAGGANAAQDIWFSNKGGQFNATLFSTGNLLIQNGGTHTDAGFRLDVNGTARVQGAITGTTTLTLGQTGTNGEVILNRSSNGATVGGIRADGNGTEIGGSAYLSKILCSNGGTRIQFFTNTERMRLEGGNLLINTTTNIASAILNINSTTQGFLPPRMTESQRTAIASPATGLIVFQTDGVEGLWLRVSTGWVELTVV
jgi:hypothetical protein